MKNKIIDLAIQNVIDIHELIELVFTGKGTSADINKLTQVFSPEFSMIKMDGDCFDHQQTVALFKKLAGAKPTLTIALHNMKVIQAENDKVWLQYQEEQHQNELAHNRTSTVCIQVTDEQCQWIYLHETAISSPPSQRK